MATADRQHMDGDGGEPGRLWDPNRHPHDDGIIPSIVASNTQKGDSVQLDIGRDYQVHAALIPWPTREWDTLDVMTGVRAFIEDARVTKVILSCPELATAVDTDHGEPPRFLDAVVSVCGGWPYREQGTVNKWVNPRYCHHPSDQYADLTPTKIPDADELAQKRKDWLRWGLSVGLSVEQVGQRWACDLEETEQYIQSQGWPIEDWRVEGRILLARTTKLLHAWGRSWTEIGAAFGMSVGSVQWLVESRAGEFTPPPAAIARRRYSDSRRNYPGAE